MAEAALARQDGAAWRAGLARKHALLRGLPDGAASTARAARFAAHARSGGMAVTFAELAQLPVWRLDPAWDRGRLAEIAGLLLARPALLRTVAGPLLRDLAERHTSALLEAVLEAEVPDAAPAGSVPSLAAADLRQAGQAVLDAHDDAAMRAIADTALALYATEERQ